MTNPETDPQLQIGITDEGVTNLPSESLDRLGSVAAGLITGLDALIAEADIEHQVAAETAHDEPDLLRYMVSIRRQQKLSQTEVARRMQTGQSAISELENDIVEPRLSTLQRYAHALDHRLWILPIKCAYTDRKFHYPPPSDIYVRVRSTREIPSAERQALTAGRIVIAMSGLQQVKFRHRDPTPLGRSIADAIAYRRHYGQAA